MLKCTVNCGEVCYTQCHRRISPQRSEAIRQLGIVDKPVRNVGNVCSLCGRKFIEVKHQGRVMRMCSCHVE